MDCKCFYAFFSAIIIAFSFLNFGFSKWIIVISAALILIEALLTLYKDGCGCGMCHIGGKKTGSEIFLEKEEKSDLPSKSEVVEVMNSESKKD